MSDVQERITVHSHLKNIVSRQFAGRTANAKSANID